MHVEKAAYTALKDRLLVELPEQAPSAIADRPVVRTDALEPRDDGFKFWLDDGSWLLVRFSGTEPLVRVYAEATSAELRDAILIRARPRARHRPGGQRRVSTADGRSLEDAGAIRRRDPGLMLDQIAHFPDQMAAAWQISRVAGTARAAIARASAVAVLGMGGSAVCGDLVRAIFADRLTVPLISVRDYDLPAWVGPTTLVVAVSHSRRDRGDASPHSARRSSAVARSRSSPPAARSVTWPRASICRALVYPDETPPRASLGYTMLAAGRAARARRATRPDRRRSRGRLLGRARTSGTAAARTAPTESNMAKQLAWSLLDRLPVIEGSGFMAAVARRWKTQLNENANSTAVAEELPEATHNTVVGYDQPDTLRDHHSVVFLAAECRQPAQLAARARLSTRPARRGGTSHQRVLFEGPRASPRRARRSAWATTSASTWRCCTAWIPLRPRPDGGQGALAEFDAAEVTTEMAANLADLAGLRRSSAGVA